MHPYQLALHSYHNILRLCCTMKQAILLPLLFSLPVTPVRAADSTNKTYRNPLLPAVVMADPHVIRVEGKYYL